MEGDYARAAYRESHRHPCTSHASFLSRSAPGRGISRSVPITSIDISYAPNMRLRIFRNGTSSGLNTSNSCRGGLSCAVSVCRPPAVLRAKFLGDFTAVGRLLSGHPRGPMNSNPPHLIDPSLTVYEFRVSNRFALNHWVGLSRSEMRGRGRPRCPFHSEYGSMAISDLNLTNIPNDRLSSCRAPIHWAPEFPIEYHRVCILGVRRPGPPKTRCARRNPSPHTRMRQQVRTTL